jgi:hypothetical protein
MCGCSTSETQGMWKKYGIGGFTLCVIVYISFWNRSVLQEDIGTTATLVMTMLYLSVEITHMQ